jgi:flagellar hook-associated protein 1 FlgK
MGLLDTSLQIGKSAIMAHSLAIDVTGNNIANADTKGYARQVVDLQSAQGVQVQPGTYLGLGVNADSIQRVSNIYLEQRLRDANSFLEESSVRQDVFARIEGIFNELSDSDLSSAINDFFTSLATLQAQPEEGSVRRAVVESALTLTDSVKTLRSKLDDLRVDIDSEVVAAVNNINALTAEVAELNVEITRLEAGATSGSAGALRDRRDVVLAEISELVEINVIELEDGAVNVFAGSDPLVMLNRSYDLAIESRSDDGVSVSDVVFANDGRELTMKSGTLAGLIGMRDGAITEITGEMDLWAKNFINEFNKIHSSGVGLDLFTEVTGKNGVDDVNALLNAAGLSLAPTTGTFEINVKNINSDEYTTFRVAVDLDGFDGDDTTLTSLVADINTAIGGVFPGVQASIGAGNTLEIESDSSELQFFFNNDSSGALAALGVNTFFSGEDALTMGISAGITANPDMIAAALTDMPGDNSNVTLLMAFQNQSLDGLAGTSVEEYYQGIVGALGVDSASAQDQYQASASVSAAIESQREALSGVSLDEEAVNLIRYQSGYAAAARFIAVVDELIQVLLNM